MHDILYPGNRTTEELNKAYYALEESKKKVGVGVLGSDEAAQESAGERYTKEEIDLLVKCYMVSHIVRQLEKLVKLTNYDVQGLIRQECTLLDFDDEFLCIFRLRGDRENDQRVPKQHVDHRHQRTVSSFSFGNDGRAGEGRAC